METIDQIKEEFKSGQLSKADFIKKIHKIHQYLFEYSELIKTTDIAKIEVEDGQEVSMDTEIGKMGATGRAFGDHLHLEVYDHGKAINPLTVLTR